MKSAEKKSAAIEAIGDIDDALRAVGVTEATLTLSEKDSIDKRGCVVLRNVLDQEPVLRMRTEFEQAVSQEQSADTPAQTGTRHANDLAYRAGFQDIFTNPRMLAAAHHVLKRSFRVFQLAGRDPLPGYGLQGLHTDWYQRALSEPYYVVTSLTCQIVARSSVRPAEPWPDIPEWLTPAGRYLLGV